jgi:hypothetical protein
MSADLGFDRRVVAVESSGQAFGARGDGLGWQ